MNLKYKILILPFLVLLLAGSTIFYEKPFKEEKTTLSKAYPVPFKPESKTEWTKPTWSNSIAKTYSTFICSLTKNEIERQIVFTILFSENNIFYSTKYIYRHDGRAPPTIS
jgi:hypothetical protein